LGKISSPNIHEGDIGPGIVRREPLRLRANRKKTPRRAAKVRVESIAVGSCGDFEEHPRRLNSGGAVMAY
jgi:hypothetical protein